MPDSVDYGARREALKRRFLPVEGTGDGPVMTGGVDHLALISSDLEATIAFYSELLGMRLTTVIPNRDEPSSTHIFLDMGGGNLLAFFDFPKHGPERTVRGVGSMHHLALKAAPESYGAVIARLRSRGHPFSLHGSEEQGSVYVRDPDGILVEITTGYDL